MIRLGLQRAQTHTYLYVCAHIPYPRLQIFECMCEDDVEHGMRSAALLVHVGRCNRTRLVSFRHQRLYVLEGETGTEIGQTGEKRYRRARRRDGETGSEDQSHT